MLLPRSVVWTVAFSVKYGSEVCFCSAHSYLASALSTPNFGFQIDLRVVREREEDCEASCVGQRIEHCFLDIANVARAIAPSNSKKVVSPLFVPKCSQRHVRYVHGILGRWVPKHAIQV